MKNLLLSTLLTLSTLSTLEAKEISLEQKITGLYIAYFDRAADLDGLNSWKKRGEEAIDNGESVNNILKELSLGFSKHNTFVSSYSSLSDEAFVNAIYHNALGNAGDRKGIDFWTNQLIGGLSRSDMVSIFVSLSLSEEINVQNFPTLSPTELSEAQLRQELISNQVDVALAFTHTLGSKTNVKNVASPENDRAYLASIKILENITTERSTVTDKIAYIESIANSENPIDQIMGEETSTKLAKDEPYYKYAWHINSKNSVLQSEGFSVVADADINMVEAWKMTMGKGVKVAVIDDGVDVEHEDLKSNIFIAYNADEDNSDVKTYSDEASHGNSCAGLIVAPINGTGIVGIAPEAKLIAIRQNEPSDVNVIKAFEYAKNQGAKVISCSWGTENVSDIVVAELKSLYDAGITVLFASGNEGVSLDKENINDESEVEWVIGVGASTEVNDVGSYSNYGSKLEVIAPGGDIEESSGILSIDDMGEHGGGDQHDLVNKNYNFMDGTSFATPVAAGVVVLMYAVNPNITPAQVRDILIATATKIGVENDADYNTEGFDKKRAYGKINAGKAVAKAKKLRDEK